MHLQKPDVLVLLKTTSPFSLALPVFDPLRTISWGHAQDALNSYQRADFPQDVKKMRVSTLQEVRVFRPRACLILNKCKWLCLCFCLSGWRSLFAAHTNILYRRFRFHRVSVRRERFKKPHL